MSDELFSVSESPLPALERARQRLARAQAAFNEADTDETCELSHEVYFAKRELAECELREINHR